MFLILRKVAAALVLALLLSPISLTALASSPADDADPAVLPLGGGKRLMTTDDVEAMKQVLGVREQGKDYNVIIDGHGTGFAPPSEEEYAAMIGKEVLLKPLPGAPSGPVSIDLSIDPHFPAVGDQGGVGSCSAWALAYYCYGYLEAKDNGWTNASQGDPRQLISPSWAYNKVNRGVDGGSWMGDVAEVLSTWGGATLSTMPYVGSKTPSSNYLYWGGEAAFREAPLHRAQRVERIDCDLERWSETLEQIRTVVAAGTPVTFVLNANVLSGSGGDKIITSTEYPGGTLNHAQTIVGYDNAKSAGGEVGAFKVVNSWGDDFWGSGYYWITYEAFKKIGPSNQLVYVSDRPGYQPSLLGVWHYSSAQRQDGSIEVTTQGGALTVAPFYKSSDQPFPNFLCLDLTDLRGEFDSGKNTFLLNVESTLPGALTSFRTELYSSGYAPGRPTQVSTASPNVVPSGVIDVRSVLTPYPSMSLAKALDIPYVNFTTGGNAAWTPSVAASTKKSTSGQSGDVSSSSVSWMAATLEGEGTLGFDWRMECPYSSDSLTFTSGGSVHGILTGSTPWAHVSLEIAGPLTEISWSFLRQGNGGGCAWVDNVTWIKNGLYIDSDGELEAMAELFGWSGTGTPGDPVIIDNYTVDAPDGPNCAIIGNTTLWLKLTECSFTGAAQAGLVLINVNNIEITDCIISGNGVGLVSESSAALVHDNLFSGNSGLAVRATASPGSIYHMNAFIGNNGSSGTSYPARPQAADDSAAYWSSEVGNYWDDLLLPDDDGDGVVDVSYVVGGSEDRRPLAFPLSEPWGVHASFSSGVVHLSWSAPNRTIFAPVTIYEVERMSAGGTASFMTGSLELEQPLGFGSHGYRVRAWSSLGAGPWSTTVSIEVPDLLPPTVSIIAPVSGAWLKTSSATVSWSGSDLGSGIDHYEVRLDGGAWQNAALSTSHVFSQLSMGNHQAVVRAFDRSGNWAEASVSFNVDLSAPSITIISPAAGSISCSSTVTISISVQDTGSGYRRDLVRLDGQLVRDYSGSAPLSFSLTLPDGPHTLSITSTDRAGNAATASIQFTVDAGYPAVDLSVPEEGAIFFSQDVSVEWSAVDLVGLAVTEMSVDGGPWTDVSGQTSTTLWSLPDGHHVVAVRAIDLCGRPVTSWSNFTVDGTAVTAQILLTEDVALEGPIVIRFSKAVDAATLRWSAPFDGTAAWDGLDLVLTPDGPLDPDTVYSVNVSAADLYGLESGPMVLSFRTTDKGVLSGLIVDSSGKPVAGATVTAPDGTWAMTDQNGSFSLTLPAGPTDLRVHRDGYEDMEHEVDVAAGETVSIGSWKLSEVPKDQLMVPAIIALAAIGAIVTTFLLVRRRSRAK